MSHVVMEVVSAMGEGWLSGGGGMMNDVVMEVVSRVGS